MGEQAVAGYATWQNASGTVKDHAHLKPLQIAELAAHKYGFYDVDVKDNDSNRVTIEARATNRTVRASGKNMAEAVSNLVEKFFK